MKTYRVLFGIAACIFAGSALAQTELIEDMHVVTNCAGEVHRLCAGVEPGEGRIKACIKEKLGEIKPACFESIIGAIIASRKAPEIKLKPGPIQGLEVHLADARDYAYCEIAPIVGTPSMAVAQFYNTSGTSGAGGGCPPDAFAAVNEKALSEKLAAAATYMNPTPQTARRHWVMDEFSIYVIGETVNFDGVKATWMASMTPKDMLSGLSGGPYDGKVIHRRSKYLYKAGSTVFLMRTADTKVYVMQSYATEVDRELTFDKLPGLGSKLKLPAGWTFEAKKLNRDLTVDPRNADGVAHIVRDELHNVYEGCGFDQACNYVP